MSEPDDRRPAAVTAPRTALVTGAGRGIGRGLALGLARHGFRVALLGRTREHLESVAAEVGDAGGEGAVAAVLPVDVTDAAGVRAAVARAEEALADDGGLGLLVNNAGVIERQEVPFADDDPEDLWRVVETNVRGPVLVTHAALPGMLARGGGRVVNLNSGAAFRASPAYTGYGLSKGALARFTMILDTQYRDAGLRVFDLAPGVVATDMTASMPTWDGRTEWTPVEASVELLVGIADGALDALSGRFVRAGADTVASLLARADDVVERDARRLRLVPYGPDDPAV
ncbi:SDR family NAD(P)-dependent oxidoreductase [Actinotalea solisilvae]|uniref:SDR family NAD(P)-dependent oxidoreductase n=1 Tax=Actinotalea solisilvae TaxID=2072922 RepID=UPI0018F17F6B|nr:SDR family NAD(P)-dependent oxidoreductase [Actinotalea solisilvae]